MENTIISGIIKQFEYYKTAADKTFDQLSFDDINWQPNDTSNSISIIVKHMVGNMLSRWTNFLTEDGEKDWRHREQEFVATYTTKNDVLQAWEKGWNCLFDAIQPLKDSDLERIVTLEMKSIL